VNDAPASDKRPVVIGFSHRSSPAALREKIFVADGEMTGFLADLRVSGVSQAIVLSTCDRVEVQAMAEDSGACTEAFLRLLGARCGISPAELGRHAVFLAGPDALRHIFAVAGSLESQVVGEPQVLGQVKEAHRRARDAGLIGPELDTALQAAYSAAKRIRNETAIGERPVTLASAAVQVARDVHGDLAGSTTLLIGSGDMGELLLEHLRAAGLKRLLVSGPSPARAAEIARAAGGHIVPFEPLAPLLAEADIVVSAAGMGRYLIGRADAEEALRRRRRRSILFLDLGVPTDIDPAIEPLDGAFRYDMDDLERVALSGRVSRETAAAEAWAIIDAELQAFARDRAGRSAGPAISALRRHFEEHRARVLLEAGGDAARATELLINRLLHDPSEVLRQLAAGGNAAEREDAERLIGDLFGFSARAADQEKKS
jgi:glutamyl-tRNA reductase